MSSGRSPFANLGVKLTALMLAWALWYVVREDLDEVREALLPVALQIAPGSNVDGELQQARVSVKLKGPRREVDLLINSGRPLLLQVRSEDLTIDQHTGTKAAPAEDLLFPDPIRPGTVRIVEMEPEKVTVRLWRVERRDVPMAPPEFLGIEDLGVQVERRRWPPKALIRAPVEQLGSLLVLKTAVDREQLRRMVEAMGDAARTTVTLPLTVTDTPTERMTIVDPHILEVTADLVRNAEVSIQVPLAIYRDDVGSGGAGGGRLRVVPDTARTWLTAGDAPAVSIAFRGNPRALAALSAQSVRAFVLTSELPAGVNAGELPLHTSDLPTGVTLARDDIKIPVER